MNEKKVLGILFVLGAVAFIYALNRESIQNALQNNTVYTITCQEKEGWVDYQTHTDPWRASIRRGGVWYFETLDGKKMSNSICYGEGQE